MGDEEVGSGDGDVGITIILNIIIITLYSTHYIPILVITIGPYPSILLAFISIV